MTTIIRARRSLLKSQVLVAVALVAGACLWFAPRPGSAADAGAEAEPVVNLFDGKTLDGWTLRDGSPVGKGWTVADGCILRDGHGGGDVFTASEYEDFDLAFEWKITAGVNNGVKYRVRPYDGQMLGPEYQIVDEGAGPAGPGSETGSLYALYETSPERALKPAGEWNAARIVARGGHIEHWLNGVKLLEADTGSDEWAERLAKSKFASRAGFGTGAGRIMLTDHAPAAKTGEDKVWFRGLTLRRLEK